MVSALVLIILNAIKGNYEEKPFQKLTSGCGIEKYCIEMDKTTYKWGTLTTTYQGPCIANQRGRLRRFNNSVQNKKLYLLQCIGTGGTSKVYHAITKDGFDCVVKLYVQRHFDDGTMKTKKEFEKDSIEHVTNEFNNYERIYKDELKDYVWMQKLNQMDCIIMPFFQPIEVQDRNDELPNIETRLKLFTAQKLAFRDCDQCWRHIGRFNDQLYLFDLGDLVTYRSEKDANQRALMHSIVLSEKMKNSVSTS